MGMSMNIMSGFNVTVGGWRHYNTSSATRIRKTTTNCLKLLVRDDSRTCPA